MCLEELFYNSVGCDIFLARHHLKLLFLFLKSLKVAAVVSFRFVNLVYMGKIYLQ